MENGITVKDRKIIVKLKCFICDSPGRALIKGITILAELSIEQF